VNDVTVSMDKDTANCPEAKMAISKPGQLGWARIATTSDGSVGPARRHDAEAIETA
jgi:hypothetical protein